MAEREEVRLFKDKAHRFLILAEESFRREFYDLAVFHLEQALQIYLKAKLLELVGDFPKTHSLILLLREIGEIKNKKEEVEQYIIDNSLFLSRLEDAYITSRYFPRIFIKKEIEDLIYFVKDCFSFIDRL